MLLSLKNDSVKDPHLNLQQAFWRSFNTHLCIWNGCRPCGILLPLQHVGSIPDIDTGLVGSVS